MRKRLRKKLYKAMEGCSTSAVIAAVPLPEITLDGLLRTVNDLKEKYPLAGMQVVESPYIPPGIVMLESLTQIGICKDGVVHVMDKPDMFKPLPIKFNLP